MSKLFLTVVNMGISASWTLIAVLLLRFLLKKSPKWIDVLLWGIVAIRLVCPLSIESVISLIPSAETISPEIIMDKSPQIDAGITIINNTLNPIISESFTPMSTESANPLQMLILILAIIWLTGITILLVYTLISYIRVRRKVSTAVLLKDNIHQCETVVSPFVLGIIKPKIYLPFNISEQDAELVIAHEKSHIRRKDYLWKPLGFLILTIHWFNPLMWLGYVLLCKDIELACDEKVVKELNTNQRADYSQALLNCSVNRRMIAACPLAFGEVGVKERVKTVLNYKKPAFLIITVSCIAVIVAAACLLTNPREKNLSKTYNDLFHNGSVDNQTNINVLENGTIEFYDEPTDEHKTPFIAKTVKSTDSYSELNAFLQRIKKQKWINDATVDRLTYYFDCRIFYGEFIYISFEQKIIYCKGYFTNLTDEDAEVIKSYNVSQSLTIVDKTKNSNVPSDDELQEMYNDGNYVYSLSSIKSEYVDVVYSDGRKENVIVALNANRIAIEELDEFGIGYIEEKVPEN